MDGSRSAERRAMQRLPADTIGPIEIHTARPPTTVGVVNLSLQGLGILMPEALPPGTSMAIQPAGDRKRIPRLTATVQHATARPDGQWLLGCLLSRYLTVDDMMALAG